MTSIIEWHKITTRLPTNQEIEWYEEHEEDVPEYIFDCEMPEDGEEILIATKWGVDKDICCNDWDYGIGLEDGFRKTEENKYGVKYERYNYECGFNQALKIVHNKNNQTHVVTYDECPIYDSKTHTYVYGNCGFEAELLKLLKKKSKIMKRRYKW